MSPISSTATKRDEILAVASRLFYERGYNQTGVQQIIHEADAAKGTFYSHFRSKEDLGLAWLKARHETWMGWLERHLETCEGTRAKLLGLFGFLAQWMESCDYRGCAFLNTLCETPCCENPLRDVVREHKSALLARIIELVEAHDQDRSREAVEATGHVLFVLFEGALVSAQNFRDAWPIRAAQRQAEALL